ncbi:squalene/phytoene synthase family protein [Sphingomonas kyeonggiensis]|uniref:Phytoene synthase n=1 Tax=Sphingomonas kyeonggiensis TaxID=1268553 RepID=A0A7W6JSW9_9SPHN|nr:squalene/phytoene synthase family protein [Sphingomonas kyeonggiensis]MBB4097805.1 phytoene synthase [Sphingomonas kyeonggiensis]
MTGIVEDPERDLVLTYARAGRRAGLAALLALDDALAKLLRTTREPALGQMRLAWWREALEKLDHVPAPAEPVLKALEAEVLPHGVTGASLVPIVHGWEVLIEEEQLAADAMRRFGEGRGQLFVAAGALLGAAGDPLAQAGQGWALADLAGNLEDEKERAVARDLARPLLEDAARTRWSRSARALGALAHRARLDLAEAPKAAGAPSRVGRLLWHRLTGR